jgi:hypothetical protein
LSVNLVSSGGTAGVKNSSHVGHDTAARTKTQTSESAPAYSVEVRNVSHLADTVKVEWFVYSKPASGHGSTHLHDSGSEQVSLPAGKSTTINFKPKPITHETQDSVQITNRQGQNHGPQNKTAAHHTVHGDKSAGWLVRAVADGEVLAVQASEPSLEAAGKNPGTPSPPH